MNYLEQVQRGIDYIEANLDFDISAAAVAKNAGLSQWHFQRIFTALTNETLKSYIRSRRLALSLDKLLFTKKRIIDIALSSGYETQESFTRAFNKAFNMTPNEYRKIGDNNLFLKKIQFDPDYLKHINTNVSLLPEIYVQTEMVLIGLKTYFYSIDSAKNNIAHKIPPLWENFLDRIDEIDNTLSGKCYGIVLQTKQQSELLEYYAAIEIHQQQLENTKLPAGMEFITVPESRYAKFTHRGSIKNIDSTVNFIYSSWLINSGNQHSYMADLEMYDQDYRGESEESIMYYAIPLSQ